LDGRADSRLRKESERKKITPEARVALPIYCTVILVVPVAQVPEDAVEALTVVVPGATSVANPGLEVENARTEVLLEVQVALPVTSLLLLSVAVNCWVPRERAIVPLGGLIVSAEELPPLVVPVIEPLTPASVAVMVTLDDVPTDVTNPVELTVAHAVELCQLAEFVTSLLPELKLAVAFNCAVGDAVKLEPPAAVVTEIEFG